MRKLLNIFSILYILSIVFYASVASASWNTYVMGAGVKYRPWDTPPAQTSIIINVARGQWAAFQIACRVSNEDVNGVDISVTTPTTGTNSLNAPIIYKEITYNVIKKSRDDGATGEWPDALVPKVDQFYSEKRNAFPFKVNRISPVYNMFDFNVSSPNPVTRNNGAKTKPTIGGIYSGSSPLNYHIKIDSGGSLGVATFKLSENGGTTWIMAGVKTGSNVSLSNGLTIGFPSQTYLLNDEWEFFTNTQRNEMVWIESYVPAEVPAGTYTSTVTVTANGKPPQTLNVQILVQNITIPKSSSIPVYYQGSRDQIAKGHFQSWQGFTQTYENIYKRYVESALKHRISLMGMSPPLTWNGSTIGGWATRRDWIAPYMNGTWSDRSALSANQTPTTSGMKFAPIVNQSIKYASGLTQSEKDYLAALDDLLIAEGWMPKAYLVLSEEAQNTEPLNAAANAAGTSISNVNPDYKKIATRSYLSAYTNIDVWAPGIYSFNYTPRSAYNTEIEKGKQLWTYRSCMSKGCNITGNSTYNKWPSDMVDATLPNLRGYYWLIFDNDVYGDLYYQVVDGYRYWHSIFSSPSPYDPWDSMFDFGGDGDGTHFFPGRPDKIGGSTHIPIETLRLKAIRMGLEDYEIFKYASDQCYKSYVKQQIESAVGTGKYYYTSPQPSNASMETARNNILSLFSQSPPSGVTKDPSCSQGAIPIPTPPPTITPTSTPTPTPSPTPTPLPSHTPTPPSDATCKMYLAVSQINTSGSPIGNIKSYELTNISTAVQVVDSTNTPALDSNDLIKDSSKSSWSSGADGNKVDKGGVGEVLLKRDKARNIFTNLRDPNLMSESNEFATSNEKLTPELLGLAPGDTVERERLIQYIQGYDSYTKNKGNNTPQKREWLLGAILHSRPLVIPYKNSRSVIFVGANDGMFHAFDNATGEELWGFIPNELLSRLKDLTSGNKLEYFVDGSPKAYITQSQKIVIFGLRRGGSNYYALDVTDPGNPKFLWEIGPETTGFSEMGQTWSTPQIGKIKYGSGEKVVCFIGGGYDENQDKKTPATEDKKGRAVYVVDLFTGQQIWRWDYKKDPNMKYSIPSDVASVDINGDGYIDRLYVGDMGGRMWSFDIKNPDPNAWSGRMVLNSNLGYTGSVKQKIFHAPDVTLEKGGEMVLFGTGDREHPNEKNGIEKFYAFMDKGKGAVLSEDNLADVTKDFATIQNLANKEGWFISLEDKGEKVLAPPVVAFGVVYFTTFTPSLDGDGIARIYALNYRVGTPIFNLNPENDTKGPKIDLSDRSKIIGTGIPSGTVISALGGRPIAYTGFAGGLYSTHLKGHSTIIPISWKEVRGKK